MLPYAIAAIAAADISAYSRRDYDIFLRHQHTPPLNIIAMAAQIERRHATPVIHNVTTTHAERGWRDAEIR